MKYRKFRIHYFNFKFLAEHNIFLAIQAFNKAKSADLINEKRPEFSSQSIPKKK